MFEQLREVIGPAPAPISTEEYKTRQMNLLSQLEEHDLLLIPSRPESIRSNDVHFLHTEITAICCTCVAGKILSPCSWLILKMKLEDRIICSA